MKYLILILIFSLPANATIYTRCKITHAYFEPDVFCIEDKGFHSKKYCAKVAKKLFDIPENTAKVTRDVLYIEDYEEHILSKRDSYWRNCSSVHLDERCWLFYGKPCL